MRHKRRVLSAIAVTALLFAAWPQAIAAQHGHPRRGPGVRTNVFIGYGHGPYYTPFYDPFFFGWYGWYPYPFVPVGYYGAVVQTSAVRLQVTPRETEVYVDGYRAGVVDDFDGTFQRLNLPPGEHEIILYLPGYRTVRQTMYLTVGATYRVRHTMEPLPPGEQAEPRPEPPPTPPAPSAPGAPPTPGAPEIPGRVVESPSLASRPESGAFGTLSIRVQPGDAEVLIDGEVWRGPSGLERLVVQVAEGTHHVVIRKPGFDEYSADVQVRRGETATLNVSLLRRDEA